MPKVERRKRGRRGHGRKHEGWLDRGKCVLPIKVDCWHQSDCHQVEVNVATLS